MKRHAGPHAGVLPALVIVLVVAGYVACFAGVIVSPALVPEPDRWFGASLSMEHPWLTATVVHALYWLLVLLAASACIAATTLAGSAALRQLADADRVADEDPARRG